MHRLDHATKPFSKNNLFETDRLPFGHRRLVFERPVVSIGVRTRLVVVNNEFANQVIEIILAERYEMAEAFRLDRLYESFDPGIQVGGTSRELFAVNSRYNAAIPGGWIEPPPERLLLSTAYFSFSIMA